MSELLNLMASPEHICCASGLNAWLAVESATMEIDDATESPAIRNVLLMAIPFVDPKRDSISACLREAAIRFRGDANVVSTSGRNYFAVRTDEITSRVRDRSDSALGC